jgi:hypothetical protein
MIGGKNKFSSPPISFETRGINVTVCPKNICYCHSGTFSINEMLSAYYALYTNKLSLHSQTNKFLLDKCDLTKIYCYKSHNKRKNVFLMGSPRRCWLRRCSDKYAPTPSRLYRKNLSSNYNCNI